MQINNSAPLLLLRALFVNNNHHHFASTDVCRILVRATNWIGDAVMNTPALAAIRATFPRAEIVLVANPIVADLFMHHPCCDRVLVFDKKRKDKGIVGLMRFSAQLRKERFDIAILLQKAIEAAIMARLARIPVIIGYKTDGRGFLLSHSMIFDKNIQDQHHVYHYLHLLKLLGINGNNYQQVLHITPAETAWATTLLATKKWVAINPGAAYGSAKRWLPERFAEVGDLVAERYGLKVILIGGPVETDIGAEIEQLMSVKPLNLIGKTTVREMMALVSLVRLMVTNDSGPMHIAAALKRPIVAVFGPTDHKTTHPYGTVHRIVRKEFSCAPCLLRECPIDHRCMVAVTVQDVMAAIAEIETEISGFLPLARDKQG